MYEVFYVDKTNRTIADELLLFGFLRLLSDLLLQQEGRLVDMRITDCGAYYEVRLAIPLQVATLERIEALHPIAFIETPKNASSIPQGAVPLRYEDDKQAVNDYFEALKKGNEELPGVDLDRWQVLRAINPASLPGYNNLVQNWWDIQADLPAVLGIVCDHFAHTPNPYPQTVSAWATLAKAHGWNIATDATCQQLYNPDQGKGQNKPKSDGVSIGNVKSLWLLEYLKAVGFYDGAMTRLVRGAKDRKSFAFVPRQLDYSQLLKLRQDFLDKMPYSETSTRFDILASLYYTQALIENAIANMGNAVWDFSFLPSDHLAGFRTVFYKDLGNAVATMNLAFLSLPGWIVMSSEEEADAYLAILEDLVKLIRQFDESHSDAYTLLQHFRDFISGDDLRAFFRFTAAFPAYYMGMQERGKYAYPLTTPMIERLMMNTQKTYSAVLQSEGFQTIAAAIRSSTVTAQYQKSLGNRKYDVRYGLGQQLLRKAKTPKAFIAALSEFIALYNAENAQVMETRPAPYRPSIRTNHLEEVIAFIEDEALGAETIANLLVAYGYARAPKQEDENENS